LKVELANRGVFNKGKSDITSVLKGMMRKRLEEANIKEAKLALAESKKDDERVEIDIDEMNDESKEIMR
jgi:hypothetical protein